MSSLLVRFSSLSELDQQRALDLLDGYSYERETYLNVRHAALYLDKGTVMAFRQWARAANVPRCKTGVTLLYRRRDLDDAVTGKSAVGAKRSNAGSSVEAHS